jgi:hypothetical protein
MAVTACLDRAALPLSLESVRQLEVELSRSA